MTFRAMVVIVHHISVGPDLIGTEPEDYNTEAKQSCVNLLRSGTRTINICCLSLATAGTG